MPEKKEWKPVKLTIEDEGGRTFIYLPTPQEHYGSDEDARGVKFMVELGALLDRLGIPNEKMYRRRLPGSSDRIVDRISMPISFLTLIAGTGQGRI